MLSVGREKWRGQWGLVGVRESGRHLLQSTHYTRRFPVFHAALAHCTSNQSKNKRPGMNAFMSASTAVVTERILFVGSRSRAPAEITLHSQIARTEKLFLLQTCARGRGWERGTSRVLQRGVCCIHNERRCGKISTFAGSSCREERS